MENETIIIKDSKSLLSFLFNLKKLALKDMFNILKTNLQCRSSFLHKTKLTSNEEEIKLCLTLMEKDALASKYYHLFLYCLFHANKKVEQEILAAQTTFKCLVLGGRV